MNDMMLESSVCRAKIGNDGGIEWIEKKDMKTQPICRDIVIRFACAHLRLVTDWGDIRLWEHVPARILQKNKDLEVCWEFFHSKCSILYHMGEADGFLERTLQVEPYKDMVIFSVESSLILEKACQEFIEYYTFSNCPTAAFLRWDGMGLCTGFSNPFFTAEKEDRRIKLSFETALILRKGEIYISEENFLGIYPLSGNMNFQDRPRTDYRVGEKYDTRYRNPSGHIPLDFCEVQFMQKYLRHWLRVPTKQFRFIFYNFFCPLPQQPHTDEEERLYMDLIDRFAFMGGDTIVFNPLVRQRPPAPSGSDTWEVAPADSRAEHIIEYAKSKKLNIGIYMGSAPDNAGYCNSSMTEFATPEEKPRWKKRGKNGVLSRENCIGSDSFAEWFLTVQKNTIRKYGLGVWNWDPGPGNGHFCYATEHGHLPGKGQYKGYRNAIKVLKGIREEFPDIYLHSFHGCKEYGPWGFCHYDQQEAYWEQTPYSCNSVYPDHSPTRLTADGVRFQSWWNVRFRFMPPSTNHGLCSRMIQVCFSNPAYRKLNDAGGAEYGLMSALAAAASVTITMIPEENDSFQRDYSSFFKKWISWARKNYKYLENTVPFQDQVKCGGVDGYAKIVDGEGFIFLCNPTPVPVKTTFCFNSFSGCDVEGTVALKEIYPTEGAYCIDFEHRRGLFNKNDDITLEVDPQQVLVMELVKTEEMPRIFGISGEFYLEKERIMIHANGHKEGTRRRGAVYIGDNSRNIWINQKRIRGVRSDDFIFFELSYGSGAQERFLFRWREEGGKRFLPGEEKERKKIVLETDFMLAEQIKYRLVENALSHIQRQILEQLQREAPDESFAWARPDRLYLVLPFTDANKVKEPCLFLNGKRQTLFCMASVRGTVMCYHVDITEEVLWGEENRLRLCAESLPAGQFLGAYLVFPEGCITQEIYEVNFTNREILSKPLDSELSVRPAINCGRSLSVMAAWVDETIREYRTYRLYAMVNLEPEQIKGVYASAQICIDRESRNLGSDIRLEYDDRTKVWSADMKPGSRQYLIMDPGVLHVWAEAWDGSFSETVKVPVEWELY